MRDVEDLKVKKELHKFIMDDGTVYTCESMLHLIESLHNVIIGLKKYNYDLLVSNGNLAKAKEEDDKALKTYRERDMVITKIYKEMTERWPNIFNN